MVAGHRPVQPRRPRHRHGPASAGRARVTGGTGGRDRRHRRHRVLQGLRPQRAAAGRARRCGPRWPTPGSRPADVDGLVTFTMDTNAEIAVARELGVRRAALLQPDRLRRRRRVRDRAAGGDGRRDRGRRRGGLLPGAERALRPPVRPGVPAGAVAAATTSGRRQRLALPDGARHARPRPWRCWPGATCTTTARPARTSAGSRWRTGGTPRPTRTPGSTSGRSRWPSTRPPAGSPSRCGCSTAARRATAPSPSWSPAWSGPATCAQPARA